MNLEVYKTFCLCTEICLQSNWEELQHVPKTLNQHNKGLPSGEKGERF